MDILRECNDRGWQLLNEKPALETEEEDAWIRHADESVRFQVKMEETATSEHGLWVVKRHYIDISHESVRTCYRFAEPHELWDIVESADFKNGVDVALGKDGKTLVHIANGQGYTRSDGLHDFVTAVFECRLLVGKTAEAVREILEIAEEYDRTYKTEEVEAARAFYAESLSLR